MDNIKSGRQDKETPLHVAKTGQIIRILLSRTTPKKLKEADQIEERLFFDQILKHHPSVMKSYLDLMVSSREDLEKDDPHLIFDLSMFDYDGDEKQTNFENEKAKNGTVACRKMDCLAVFMLSAITYNYLLSLTNGY